MFKKMWSELNAKNRISAEILNFNKFKIFGQYKPVRTKILAGINWYAPKWLKVSTVQNMHLLCIGYCFDTRFLIVSTDTK